MFERLNKVTRGIVLIVTGSIILLYSLGIFSQRLSLFVMAIAIGMIAYGVYLIEGHKKIMNMVKGKKGTE